MLSSVNASLHKHWRQNPHTHLSRWRHLENHSYFFAGTTQHSHNSPGAEVSRKTYLRPIGPRPHPVFFPNRCAPALSTHGAARRGTHHGVSSLKVTSSGFRPRAWVAIDCYHVDFPSNWLFCPTFAERMCLVCYCGAFERRPRCVACTEAPRSSRDSMVISAIGVYPRSAVYCCIDGLGGGWLVERS